MVSTEKALSKCTVQNTGQGIGKNKAKIKIAAQHVPQLQEQFLLLLVMVQVYGYDNGWVLVLLRIPSSRPSPRTFPQFVRVQVLGFLAAENDGFET